MEGEGATVELGAQEAIAALVLGGLWPSLASPFTVTLGEQLLEVGEEAGQVPGAGLASLREQGLLAGVGSPQLAEGFREALWTLADPTAKMVVCFGTADAVGMGRYYARADGGRGLVLYQPQETGRHLFSYFHSPLELLESVDQYIGFAPTQCTPELTLEMGLEEYAVLLGWVDAQRTGYLEGMLRREPPSLGEFTAAEVQAMLDHGQEYHDMRWLVPLFEITSPLPVEIAEGQVGSALAELAHLGCLLPSGERPGAYRASPRLEELVEDLLALVSFFYFGLSRLRSEDGVWEDTYFCALRSLTSLWVADYLDLGSLRPWVRITSMRDQDLREAMSELLLDDERWPSDAELRQAAVDDRAAGWTLEQEETPTRVSTGHPAVSSPDRLARAAPSQGDGWRCPQCGARNDPGRAFCTACGAPLATVSRRPEPGALVVVDGPNAGRSYPIEEGLRIGRGESNDVVLALTLVSRHHAAVRCTSEGYAIVDLGSRNGTYLNGARIEGSAPLRDGDTIAIGGISLRARLSPAVSPTRFCPSCGAPVVGGGSFCTQCGARVP